VIEWPYDDARAFAVHGNPLFGEGWEGTLRAADPDVFYADVPVGEPCMTCDEAVQADDTGELMWLVPGGPDDGPFKVVAQHMECGLLTVIGHDLGVCSCTNYCGLSVREAAIEAMRRFRERHAG
jgi:hypothetical protein